MHKSCMMDSIKKYDNLEGKGTQLCPTLYNSTITGVQPDGENGPVFLPKVQIICATKSAEARINGKLLKHGKILGLPSSIYKLIQQFGCVARDGSSEPGSNTY